MGVFCALLLGRLPGQAASSDVSVRTADGSVLRGRLVDTSLVFASSIGRTKIQPADIVRFDSTGLILRDQSSLKGSFVALNIRLRSSRGIIAIPTKQIRAIEPVGSAGPPTEPGATTANIRTLGSGATPASTEPLQLPSAYGWYAVRDGRLTALPSTEVATVIGVMIGRTGRGMAADGFTVDPTIRMDPNNLRFLVYQQGIQAAKVRLGLLGFIPDLLAGQFDAKKDPLIFVGMYGKDKTDRVKLNLWRVVQDIPFRVEPVPGHPDMFLLTPTRDLSSGRYALFEGEALHPMGESFQTGAGRQSSGIYFLAEEPSKLRGRSALDSILGMTADDSKFDDVAADYARDLEQVRRAIRKAAFDRGDVLRSADTPMTYAITEGVHGGLFKYLDRFYIGLEDVGGGSTRVHVKLMRYNKDIDAGTYSIPEVRERTKKAANDFVATLSAALSSAPTRHELALEKMASAESNLQESPRNLTGAEKSYREVIALEPQNRDALFNLSIIYLTNRDGKSLTATARKLVEIDPLSSKGLTFLQAGYELLNVVDSITAVRERIRVLPVDVWMSKFEVAKDGATLSGMVSNRLVKSADGSTLTPVKRTLIVEFLDDAGAVVASSQVGIRAMHGDENQMVSVSAKKPGIAMWRYREK